MLKQGVEDKNMPLEKRERTEDMRENKTREKEWTYEEQDALHIPDMTKARFDSQDMHLRWIRINNKGVDDYLNVGKKLNEGWVFVTPDEVPEMSSSSIVIEGGRYAGVVNRGDLALAKIVKGQHTARTRHFEDKSRDLVTAVEAQMEGKSDSRMPISNSSKSQIVKGRQPSFQD
tara:strand:- start:266 stop:787 length:522 start_codon:yes stop_codon:yes gene_type:complete